MMTVPQIIVNILLIIDALVLIVTVLMQSSESDGMSALAGGSESFFGKNKGSTFEGKMAFITKVSAGVFVALALVAIFIA